MSPDNPSGWKLEDAIVHLRNDLLARCAHIVKDQRPTIRGVLNDNLEIIRLLSLSLERAQASGKILASLGVREGGNRGR